MTRFTRTLVGIGVGALVTLLAHPISRAILLSPMRGISISHAYGTVDTNLERLPEPETREGASAWIQDASDRILNGRSVSPRELDTILKIAQAGGKREPENAFWFQMQAVFGSQLNRRADAIAAWKRASNCISYNDFQSSRLLASREQLAKLQGMDSAWQFAFLYPQRSDAFAVLTERFARSIIAVADYDSTDGIDLRFVTIINADLLRTGSRWIPIANLASDLIEISTYPADMMSKPTPKNLHLGKVRVLDSLRRNQRTSEFVRTDRALYENEAWRYMVLRRDTEDQIQILSTKAAIVAGAPTGLFCAFLVGAFVLYGRMLLAKLPEKESFEKLSIVIATILGGLVMYFLCRYWLSAVTLSLSILFLIASPKNQRTHPPEDVGPLYRLTTFSLSLFLAVCISAYFACMLSPVRISMATLHPEFDIDVIRNAIGGAIGLALCIFLLCNPLWAFVVRVSTPHMIRLSFLRLGTYLTFACLIATIVATVLAIPVDRSLSRTWHDLIANEPNYYLSR